MTDLAEKNRLFNQIIAETEEGIFCMARQYAPVGEAEDLYQEIVCDIWMSLDRFKGLSAPVTWAWSLALNRAYAYRQKRSRRNRIMRGYRQEAQSGHGGGLGEEQILREFVQSLTDVDRNIFGLSQAAMSYQEIARLTSMSEMALRARMKRLKHQFEQRYL